MRGAQLGSGPGPRHLLDMEATVTVTLPSPLGAGAERLAAPWLSDLRQGPAASWFLVESSSGCELAASRAPERPPWRNHFCFRVLLLEGIPLFHALLRCTRKEGSGLQLGVNPGSSLPRGTSAAAGHHPVS